MFSPWLSPLDYSRVFVLDIVASKSSNGVALVQENDSHLEHIIYYLSRGLTGSKLQYYHVENLA